MFKTTSVLVALSLMVFAAAPAAFADSIVVSNQSEATITNNVSVSSNTGGNLSQGGDGENGGAGGAIVSGDATAVASVYTEANTAKITVEDNSSDEHKYNETLDLVSQEGSSNSSASFGLAAYLEKNESSVESEDWSSSSSGKDESKSYWSKGSPSSSEESSSSYSEEDKSFLASLKINADKNESEEHDNLELHYTRTYVGGNDSITVENDQQANLTNNLNVAATTGDNESIGGAGSEGDESENNETQNWWSGRDWHRSDWHHNDWNNDDDEDEDGFGGAGGYIETGASKSASEIVSVVGSSVIRVVKN